MHQVKTLSELTVAGLWEEINISEEEISGDLKLEAQVFLKRILEGTMETEVMDYLGISRKSGRFSERGSHRRLFLSRVFWSQRNQKKSQILSHSLNSRIW